MLIKEDQDIIKSYFEDSSNLKGGHADSVVFPEDIDVLSEFVKEANKRKCPITVSGGGTGTTGSRIPFGGAVISLEKFNKILRISKDRMFSRAQAGVLVDDFKSACKIEGLFYACHPTEGGAFLGGTIATNASGARSFKYGSTRRYVRALKMVLATGEIVEVKRGERLLTRSDSRIRVGSGPDIIIALPSYKMPDVKNSAGYFAYSGMDLIDLFIGQEGTLSIIAEIELALLALPYKILSSFVFFNHELDAWDFARDARYSSALSIEYFDKNALNLLKGKNSNIPAQAAAAIFFEEDLAMEDEDRIIDKWSGIISKHNASLENTWVAMTEDEAEAFNQMRHYIPESVNEIVKRNGFRKISTDIAVPEKSFLKMMNFYVDTLRPSGIGHVIFGHIGECHVHVNLLPKNNDELEASEKICMMFAKKAVSLEGTVSAEHGIGKTRRPYLEQMYGRDGILEMARIKNAFDPNHILGLDNIFQKETLSLV
jgi:D-lactate dehydrogenase (cytochrome)